LSSKPPKPTRELSKRPPDFFAFLLLLQKGDKLMGQNKRTTPPPYFLKTFCLPNLYYCICENPLESWQLRGEKLFVPKGRTYLGGILLGQRKNIMKGDNHSN
jgi:hypothetical protein